MRNHWSGCTCVDCIPDARKRVTALVKEMVTEADAWFINVFIVDGMIRAELPEHGGKTVVIRIEVED